MTDALTATQNWPAVELVSRARQDPLRQTFHFVAPAGWLNDPNGVGERNGIYHLFYQHNPVGAFHDKIHWGHAVSTDLVHWEDRPIALTPGEGADAEGCWSGVLVADAEPPTIIYSGRVDGRELACLAHGSHDLDEWLPRVDPVIAEPPESQALTAYRDHCVWWEDGTWRQLIGSGLRGRGGCAFLYESTDLVNWTELGPLVVGEAGEPDHWESPEWTGTMWECVDFFRMTPGEAGETGPPDGGSGEPHVLIFSAWHEGATLHSLAALGEYDGEQFTIHSVQRLDFGGRYAYAPQSFVDPGGRRLLWAWMQEGRSDKAQVRAGWSGAMTVPRRIWLDEQLRLCAEPIAELAQLREEMLPVLSRLGIMRQGDQADPVDGRAADIEVDVHLTPGDHVEIGVFATADGVESTQVRLERNEDGTTTLSLDRTRSTLDASCDDSARAGRFKQATGPSTIRILTDRSSLEVFVEGVSLTSRVYPTRNDARAVTVRGNRDDIIEGVRIWPMAAVEQLERQIHPSEKPHGD